MKKVLLFISLFFLMFSVKAQTIIDNYNVDITFNKNQVFEVKESFEVTEADDEVFLRPFNYEIYDVKTNLKNFKKISGNFYTYYSFNLEKGKEYYLKYKYNKIIDYKEYQIHSFDFKSIDKGFDYIYKGLNIKFTPELKNTAYNVNYFNDTFREFSNGKSYFLNSKAELHNYNFGIELEVTEVEEENHDFMDKLPTAVRIIIKLILVVIGVVLGLKVVGKVEHKNAKHRKSKQNKQHK